MRVRDVAATLLVVAVSFMLTAGVATAKPAAELDQIRNDKFDDDPIVVQWVHGNAGPQNAHYAEGHSIPYRAILTDMPPNSVVTLILGYDIKHGSRHALDYLTHYQRLEPHGSFGHPAEVIDPLDDTALAGLGLSASTYQIPQPDTTGLGGILDGPDPSIGIQPVDSWQAVSSAGLAYMSMWNGQILDIDYAVSGDLSLAKSETTIEVTFQTSDLTQSDVVVLSWGGHIASRTDWGFDASGTPRSAGGISGSPYHMRLLDWSLGNLGSQDRSLKASAVFAPPPPDCDLTGPDLLCTDTGTAGYDAVTTAGNPSYLWTIENNTSGASIVGADNLSMVDVDPGSVGGSFTLMLTITDAASDLSSTCSKTVTVSEATTVTAEDDICYVIDPRFPAVVPISATIGGGATGVTWTHDGAGTIADPNALSTTYTSTIGEVTGIPTDITLTVTTDDPEGPCVAVADGMTIALREICPPGGVANEGGTPVAGVLADGHGAQTLRGATPAVRNLPTEFRLGAASPNPIRGGAAIRFELPVPTPVSLQVFDVTGRLVRTLEDSPQEAGRFEAIWDGRNSAGTRAAAGVYFYRLVAGEFRDTQKMVLLH